MMELVDPNQMNRMQQQADGPGGAAAAAAAVVLALKERTDLLNRFMDVALRARAVANHQAAHPFDGVGDDVDGEIGRSVASGASDVTPRPPRQGDEVTASLWNKEGELARSTTRRQTSMKRMEEEWGDERERDGNASSPAAGGAAGGATGGAAGGTAPFSIAARQSAGRLRIGFHSCGGAAMTACGLLDKLHQVYVYEIRW